ncbi:MAG: glycosyltransferase [Planctomycetes bacterium]|nr:glycosyltransferase [Planctomycetota bacterium]
MRIAMFSWESMHSVAIGGLAPHVTELSEALHRRGHEIHVFTRVGMGQSSYDLIGGVHYHRCPYEPHADFVLSTQRMCDSFVWHMAETEHFLGAAFDVVHGHDWLATKAIVPAKDRHHRPTVLTIHSTEYGRCGNSLWDDEMSGRIRALEWEGTYVADRVICVSRTLGDEVHRLYHVPTDKLFPIYNGVDPSRYDGPVDVRKVRDRYSLRLDDPVVLFAGRLTWQKGPDLLIDAIPRFLDEHPRAKVVFAGDGDMRAGLEQSAEAGGLSRAIRFLGHRNGRELVDLFKSVDLVCVPSRNEPFGIVILEAWSAEKPVVATRIGGPTEFVDHGRTGLTVDPAVEPIGRGVAEVIADADAARTMGLNGRREVESRFSWDRSAEATEKVYLSVLNGAGLARAPVNGQHRGEFITMAKQGTVRPRPGNGKPDVLTAKTAAAHEPQAVPAPTEPEIRARAHAIYLARNGAPGDPVADWLLAERQLREERRAQARPVAESATRPPRTPARVKAEKA